MPNTVVFCGILPLNHGLSSTAPISSNVHFIVSKVKQAVWGPGLLSVTLERASSSQALQFLHGSLFHLASSGAATANSSKSQSDFLRHSMRSVWLPHPGSKPVTQKMTEKVAVELAPTVSRGVKDEAQDGTTPTWPWHGLGLDRKTF